MSLIDGSSQRKSSRNKIANSSDELTVDFMKALLSNQKNEIVDSFSAKIDSLKSTVTLLMSTINKLEEKVQTLEREQKQQVSVIKSLEEHFEVFASYDFDPEDIVYEAQQRFERADNLVLFGVPESHDGGISDKRDYDAGLFKEIVTTLNISDVKLVGCSRIGKPRRDGHRILRVKLESREKRLQCLRKSMSLKHTRFRNVFIKADLTPYQQAQEWEMREELKARRAKGEDVVFLHGKIQKRPQNFTQ